MTAAGGIRPATIAAGVTTGLLVVLAGDAPPSPSPGVAPGDTIPERAELTGIVTRQDSTPLSGARVEVLTLELEPIRTGKTAPDGAFRLDSLPAGRVYVVARARGFVSDIRGPIELTPSEAAEVSFALRARRASPDTLPVRVGRRRDPVLASAGFYRRRANTAGDFMTAPEIRDSGAATLSRLVGELVPDARIIRSPAGDGVVLPGGQDSMRDACFPLVYVDGTQVGRAGPSSRRGGNVSLNSLVDLESLRGVEVYSSSAEVPGAYSGVDSRCGVILLWTGIR